MGCSNTKSENSQPRKLKVRKKSSPVMVNEDLYKDLILNTKIMLKAASVDNHYSIEKTIGTGGYSVVKLASFLNFDNWHVAVKSMHKTVKDQCLRSCIIHEMDVLSRLDHPFIIKYHEAYEADENIDAILEYSPGLSLEDLLEHLPKGQWVDKLIIMYLVCKAVGYLKNQKVIHRDLKPSNVMVATDKNLELGYSIQLVDFGFCKDKSGDKTLWGSPKYMAPEALLKNSSHASDVWSLGIMLYYMISGDFPFSGDDKLELYEAISMDPLQFSPAYVWDDVPYDTICLIERMLEKDPKKRISIEEVLSHNTFRAVHQIIKPIELSDEEITKIKVFNSLSKFGKKVLEYASRYVSPELVAGVKERFVIFDSNNLGYIPIVPNISSKYSSTKSSLGRLRSISDCATDAMSMWNSEKRVPQASKINSSGFIAAMVDHKIIWSKEIAALIYNNFKSVELAELIPTDQFWNSTFFKIGEESIKEELGLILGQKEGISQEWLTTYLESLGNKLSTFA